MVSKNVSVNFNLILNEPRIEILEKHRIQLFTSANDSTTIKRREGREYVANAAENGGKVPVWLEHATHCRIVQLNLSHRYRGVRVSQGST